MTAQSAERARPAGKQRRPAGPRSSRSATSPRPAACEATRVEGGGAAATAAAIAELRDRLFGSPPEHVVIAPEGEAAFAMPAAAWAARSGDPVLFAAPGHAAGADRRRPAAPPEDAGLRPRPVLGDLLRRGARRSPRSTPGCAASPARTRSTTRSPWPATHDGGFGWNVNDPGHGFVVARCDSPLDAAAAAPLSASGTWGPLLLTDDADTLPAALRGYLLDVKPGYTTDPTRAFYNHVWVIGDQEAIDVEQQAEIDSLAELAKIGGEEP